jgi:hypothetical protein
MVPGNRAEKTAQKQVENAQSEDNPAAMGFDALNRIRCVWYLVAAGRERLST